MAQVSPEAKYAFQEYKKRGLSDHAAAGFVGNLMGESQVNPKAIRKNDAGPGLHSYGIGQWNRERFAGLKRLAAERGTSWDDLDTQIEWGWQEMNTTEAGTLARLKAAQDVDTATDAGIMYERPVGSDKGPRNGHNWSGRNANARALLGMAPGSVAEFTSTASPATGPYNPTAEQVGPEGISPVNSVLAPEAYAEQRANEPRLPGLYNNAPTFLDMMDAAPKELPTRHIWQFMQAESERPDQNWLSTRTMDTFNKTPGYQGLNPQWQEWVVQNSVSPESVAQKIEFAMDQMHATDTLDRGGISGLGVRLLAGVTDPSIWALEIGTGGVGGTAAIASRLGRATAEAGRQGAIMGASNAVKLDTTPNYSVRDLAIDSSVAMAAGGVFGAIAAKVQHVDPTLGRDMQEAFAAHSRSQIDDVARAMGGSSAGAAQVGNIPYALTAEGIERAQSAIDTRDTLNRVVDKGRIDAHAAGVATGDAKIIATMDSLMPDPVGTGGVVEKGKVDAHTWMDKELKGIQTEYDTSVEDAFTAYLEETSNGRGAGIFDINTRLEKRKEFATAITNAVETADRSELPKSLQRVADAQSRHNARVLKAAQDAGYKPAQGIEHSPTYMPRNKNRENVRAVMDEHGYEGTADGIAQAMAKASPEGMQTFASRFAHREARLEAGWAVDDARMDVMNKVKDDLGEDLETAVAKAKDDIENIKAEKQTELDDLKRYHDETIREAQDYAKTLRKQAVSLRGTVEEGGVDRAGRIQQEVQDLLDLADETVKAAKEAAKYAKAAVRNHAARRRNHVLDEQKGNINAAKKHASAEALNQLDTIEPKLLDVWNSAYREAADTAFKQATKLWYKRYSRKYLDTLIRVTEKNDASFMRGMSGEDREAFKKYLIDGGMADEEAEMAVMMMKGPDQKGVRNTRRRAPLDADLEVFPTPGGKGFRVKDMFERDALKTSEQYRRTMLSAAALARAGFHSEAAARTHIADITNVEKLRRAGTYVSPKMEADYRKAAKAMNKYVDNLLGYPDSDPENFKLLKSTGRSLRNMAFASFMVMNGISQIGDAPKIIARSGIAAAFSQFDLADIFRVFRTGTAGRAGNELAEGLELLTGQGTNTSRTRVFKAYDGLDRYYGESFTERMFGRAEHITKGMASATSLIGMSAPVTDFLTRWATRSALQTFVNHAQGKKAIGAKLLKDMGFTEDMAKNLNAMIKDGAIELADTGVVKKLHLDKLDAKWARELDELMSNVVRESKVQVLEASPAHLPPIMQNDLGRLMGQFKTFMLASYASNSLRGIKMHDASSASSLILSSVVGAATYAMTVHMRAFGMTEEKREAYLDRMLYSRKGAATAALGRSGDLTVLPFVVDSMLEPLSWLSGQDMRVFDGSRTSGLGNDLVGGLPFYQMAKRVGDLTFGSMIDAVREDQQVTQQEAMNRLSTIIPWLRTYGLLNATQAMLSHLPDREPRDTTFLDD